MNDIASSIELLRNFDTPTICNALEIIDNGRRSFGYTRRNMIGMNIDHAPVAGIAFTATMRSAYASSFDGPTLKQERLKYYEHMYRDLGAPKICVMQDLDGDEAGTGPFWGEFNTRVHRAMGFKAIVTDGSIRDATKLPTDVLIMSKGLRPSHAHVHIVSYGQQVNVFGMTVTEGDLVHVDQHGAVTFPTDWVEEVAVRAREFIGSEAPIIEACKNDTLGLDELKRLYMAR